MTVHPPVRSSEGRVVSKERLEAAAQEGRRLAAQGAGAPGAPLPAENPVEILARSGIPRLRDMGVLTEVVRARRGCLVVRTTPRIDGYAAEACALVQAWLGALPAAVYGAGGTVAESSCGARGGRACMHTLMWQEPAAIGRLPLDPPSRDGAGPSVASQVSQSGGALPVSSPGAAIPIPIPAAYGTTPAAPPPSSGPPAWSPASPGVALTPLDPRPGSDPMPVPVPPLPVPPLPATWLLQGFREPLAEDGTLGARRGADTPVESEPGREPADGTAAAGRRGRWAWLRRRAWLVAVGLLAGSLGGYVAGSHSATAYSATAVLVVQATGSTAATSSANGAEELAVTYAALIPDDQSLLHRAATDLGMTVASVSHSLSVQSESGTALVQVHFSSAIASAAVKGANRVAQLLSSGNLPGKAIAPGSVAVVSSAASASRSGKLHKYGLPLGVLGGLVVGAVAALVAERTDRRVDDLDALGGAADCSATVVPGGLTAAELARSLQRSGGDRVTVVPVRAAQHEAANDLAWAVRETWPGTGPEVLVSPAFADTPESVSSGSGQTLLVVGAGERATAVREVAERLRLLGRGPTWAVLVPSDGGHPDGRAR